MPPQTRRQSRLQKRLPIWSSQLWRQLAVQSLRVLPELLAIASPVRSTSARRNTRDLFPLISLSNHSTDTSTSMQRELQIKRGSVGRLQKTRFGFTLNCMFWTETPWTMTWKSQRTQRGKGRDGDIWKRSTLNRQVSGCCSVGSNKSNYLQPKYQFIVLS